MKYAVNDIAKQKLIAETLSSFSLPFSISKFKRKRQDTIKAIETKILPIISKIATPKNSSSGSKEQSSFFISPLTLKMKIACDQSPVRNRNKNIIRRLIDCFVVIYFLGCEIIYESIFIFLQKNA